MIYVTCAAFKHADRCPSQEQTGIGLGNLGFFQKFIFIYGKNSLESQQQTLVSCFWVPRRAPSVLVFPLWCFLTLSQSPPNCHQLRAEITAAFRHQHLTAAAVLIGGIGFNSKIKHGLLGYSSYEMHEDLMFSLGFYACTHYIAQGPHRRHLANWTVSSWTSSQLDSLIVDI